MISLLVFFLPVEHRSYRNHAKFDLFCFYRFGGAKGAAHYKAYFLHCFCTILKLFENDPFLKPFGKKTRICSTGLEIGCKPVLCTFFTSWIELNQGSTDTKKEELTNKIGSQGQKLKINRIGQDEEGEC